MKSIDNFPPLAKDIVLVDFDGTIIPWGEIYDTHKPIEGVASALWQLHSRGYKIIIFTSRMSPRWWKEAYKDFDFLTPERFGEDQYRYVRDILNDNNIPWDEITCEKYPANVYFDDRAIRISDGMPLSLAIPVFLMSEGKLTEK